MNLEKLALLDVLRAHCKNDAEFIRKSKSIYGKGNCPPALIPWIPEIEVCKPQCVHDKPRSIFAQIDKTVYKQNLWALVIFAMPPYFHNKYHSIDIQKLITYSENSNYIALSSVYCMWNEAYGLPLLNFVYKQQKSVENIEENKIKWHIEIANAVHYSRVIWEGMDIDKYKDRDLVDDPDSFTIEPKILIQLPWKPILFHQWLAAILLLIVDIDQKLLNVKHWPVHNDLIPTAINFLKSMQALKERILLGFAILNEQITKYPLSNPKHPQYIMDVIIIPSLPFLESLFTGNQRKIIESLNSESILTGGNAKYIPEEYFTIDSSLAELYSKLQYNFPMWLSKDLPTLYPIANDTIENIITRITIKEKCDIRLTNIDKKSLSLEEKYLLFDYIKNNYHEIHGMETDIIVNLLKDVMRNNLIVGITFTRVKKFFQNRKTQEKAKLILDINCDDLVVQALRHAIMFQITQNLLTRPDNYIENECITSQLIVSHLIGLKCEQLYRLINLCKIIFDIKTKNVKLTIAPALISESNKKLSKIRKDVLKMKREVLWSKLPIEWRQSIDSEMDISSEKPDEIFKIIENRIGRLVFNIAKNSYQTVESGNVYFPDTNFIQFIIPSLAAALYENYKIYDEINKEYLALIHGLIQLFENNYKYWLENIDIEFEIIINKNSDQLMSLLPIQYKNEWSGINNKMRELVRQVIGYKVLDSGDYFSYIFGIDKVINNTHDYTNQLGSEDEDKVGLPFINLLNILYKSVYKLSHYLLKAAFDTFQIQIPGIINIKYPKISELYFISTIISELQTLFDISKIHIDPGDTRELTDGEVEDKLNSMFTDELKRLRYDILVHVCEPEEYEPITNKLMQRSRKMLLPIYMQLKEYRKVRSEILSRLKHFLPFTYLNNTPSRFNHVIQLYIDGNFNALDKEFYILFNNTD